MRIIVGKINRDNVKNHWNIEETKDFCIGDYAIVENVNGYDLVEIIGELLTTDEYVKEVVGKNISKNVIQVIERKKLIKS